MSNVDNAGLDADWLFIRAILLATNNNYHIVSPSELLSANSKTFYVFQGCQEGLQPITPVKAEKVWTLHVTGELTCS